MLTNRRPRPSGNKSNSIDKMKFSAALLCLLATSANAFAPARKFEVTILVM